MRTVAAKTLVVLRFVYIAFALVLGVGFTVGSLGYLWEGIEVATGAVEYGLDGPEPLSFGSYGRGPVIAAMFLLIAFAALRRRWEMLWLPSSFLISFVTVVAVAGVFYDGWDALLGLESIAWLLVPMAGIGIVVAVKMPSNSRTTLVEPMLAVLVATSYVWRAIAVAGSVEATRAMDTLRGGQTFYPDAVELVSGSIVGLGAAIALLFAAVLFLWGKCRALDAALAFTAGLSFPGFLQALDFAFGLQEGRNVAYAVQEAVAFITCATALAITILGRRKAFSRTVA